MILLFWEILNLAIWKNRGYTLLLFIEICATWVNIILGVIGIPNTQTVLIMHDLKCVNYLITVHSASCSFFICLTFSFLS